MNLRNLLINLSLIVVFSPTVANALLEESIELNSQDKQAEASKHQTNNNLAIIFRPPSTSEPKYTVGGGTRGDSCAIDQAEKNEITALVPAIEQSLTMQERPSFFAYVSPMNEEKSARLIVKDKTENYYYSQKLTIPATGGIIKITLDDNAPPLQINQQYTWFLRIQCNSAYLEPEDPQINHSITRVEGNIDSMNQEQLVLFYTDSQVWYDSLTSAFELSESGKHTYWNKLLNSIGMERFTKTNDYTAPSFIR